LDGQTEGVILEVRVHRQVDDVDARHGLDPNRLPDPRARLIRDRVARRNSLLADHPVDRPDFDHVASPDHELVRTSGAQGPGDIDSEDVVAAEMRGDRNAVDVDRDAVRGRAEVKQDPARLP